MTPRFSKTAATRHLRELARELGVHIRWRPHPREGACLERKTTCGHPKAWIPVPRSKRSYYTGLHELGHATEDQVEVMDSEEAAWAWARKVALWPPTPAVERGIAYCLAKYSKALGSRDGERPCSVCRKDHRRRARTCSFRCELLRIHERLEGFDEAILTEYRHALEAVTDGSTPDYERAFLRTLSHWSQILPRPQEDPS